MKEKHVFWGELGVFIGLWMCAISMALYSKGAFGMSPIGSLCYAANAIFPFFTIGTWTYTLQCTTMIILIFVIHQFKWGYAFSFVIAVFFGNLVDFCNWMFAWLPENILPLRLLYFAGGFLTLAIGVSLFMNCKLPVLPFETFVRDVSKHFGWKVQVVKTCFDVVFISGAVLSTWFCLGRVEGAGFGTLVGALFTGTAVGVISGWLTRRFTFVVRFDKLKNLS